MDLPNHKVLVHAAMMAASSVLLLASVAFGQNAISSPPAATPEPTASTEAQSGLQLWSPIDLADIPFRYTCAARRFHAVDLVEAPSGLEVEPPIPTVQRVLYNDGTDAMVAVVRDPSPDPKEGALWYTRYEWTGDGWETVGWGNCVPWAWFSSVGGLGGYWRLDPSRRAPGPESRRVHLKVWYRKECRSGVHIKGRPRVQLTDEAVLIAVPVKTRIHTDMCIGGRAERVTVRLPEPLGDRQLYDAGTLPIRPVDVAADPASVGGQWGPLAVIDDAADGGLDAAGGAGRLRIGDRCVFLLADNGFRTTLVWRSGQTAWDPVRRHIVFEDPDLGRIRLSHNDRISLGGAATGEGKPNPVWLAVPGASCPSSSWVVHQVEFVER